MTKLVVECIGISNEDSQKPVFIGIRFPTGVIHHPITLNEMVEFVNKILDKCILNGDGIKVDVELVK